jgi:hypothetical protein
MARLVEARAPSEEPNAAMKESARSLRAYFVVAGLVSGYLNAKSLMSTPGLLVLVFSLASLLIALGFLYVGAVLPKLLAGSTQPINLILGGGAIVNVASGVLALVAGPAIFMLVVSGVGLLICWYLYANTKRLAAEARVAPAK